MSLSDITLNSKVYSATSLSGTRVVRTCSAATLPAGMESSTLEISHTPGSGNKPDRHLLKRTDVIIDSVTGKSLSYQMHMVVTVPQGQSLAAKTAMFVGSGKIADDIGDLLATNSAEIAGRLVNGEFS